jgi:hypothetical protein
LCSNKVDALTKTNSSVYCMCHYGTHSSCCSKVMKVTQDIRAYVCYKCVDEFDLDRHGGGMVAHHKKMDKYMNALSKLPPMTFVTPSSYNATVNDLHGEDAASGDEGDEYEDDDEYGDEDEDEDEYEDEYEDEDDSESGMYQQAISSRFMTRVVL